MTLRTKARKSREQVLTSSYTLSPERRERFSQSSPTQYRKFQATEAVMNEEVGGLTKSFGEALPAMSDERRASARDFLKSRRAYRSSEKENLERLEEHFQEDYEKGHMKKKELEREKKLLKEAKMLAHSELAAIRRGERQLGNEMTASEGPDWFGAYQNLLVAATLSRGEIDVDSKRDTSANEPFGKAVKESQGAFEVNDPLRYYDCISGQEHFVEHGVASHLFPAYLGMATCAVIFGANPEEGFNTLWNTGNGLATIRKFENHIETGRMSFVPVHPITSPIEYRLVVLDYSIGTRKLSLDPPDGALMTSFDNKQLVFRGKARPHPKYVYFHWAISILRAQARGNKHILWDRLRSWEKFFDEQHGPTEPWYERSVLHRMADFLGDDAGLISILFPDSRTRESKLSKDDAQDTGCVLAAEVSGVLAKAKEKEEEDARRRDED